MDKVSKNIFLVFCIGLASSCVYNHLERPVPSEATEQVTEKCIPKLPDTVSFKRDLVPIFITTCTDIDCHSGNSPQGDLNLSADMAYSQLNRVYKGYLDTKTPTNSLFYNSLTSPANIMPPTGKMDDCKIVLIIKWMGQGAKNN